MIPTYPQNRAQPRLTGSALWLSSLSLREITLGERIGGKKYYKNKQALVQAKGRW